MRFSEFRFLALAALLHAVIPVAAHFVEGQARAEVEAAPVRPIAEIEIDTRNLHLPEVVEPQKLAAIEPETTRMRPVDRLPDLNPQRENTPTPNRDVDDPYAPSEPSKAPEPAAPGNAQNPSSDDQYDPLLPDHGSVLTGPPGLGRSVWTMPGVLPDRGGSAPAPTAPPAPKVVDRDIAGKLLRGELKSRDKDIGIDLPAAGTVASVLGAAVRSIETPNEGRASFAVRLSPTGKVLEVKLINTSAGNREVWERAAKAAAAQLASRSLAMTGEFSSGAMVYVNVSSVLTMPSGSKGGVQRNGAGAQFDLSDIGAHMVRKVSTSFSVVPIKNGG